MNSETGKFPCRLYCYVSMPIFIKHTLISFLTIIYSFRRKIISFSMLLFSLCLISCTAINKNSPDIIHISASSEIGNIIKEPVSEYILQIGDVVDVKFYYNSKLNELVEIRPDGRISLQLIDEVMAYGLTSSELDRTLTEKYSKLIVKPEVAIIVKKFIGQQVYVGGEVKKPGVIPITGKMTTLQAIYQAGGFSEAAHSASVVIISRNQENIPVSRTVNIKKIISGKVSGMDDSLSPFDVVYVPKSFIAKANRFVDQYVRQMIPVTLNAGFNYVRGKQHIVNENGTSNVFN